MSTDSKAPDRPVGLVGATWALMTGLAFLLAGAGLASAIGGVRAEIEGFPKIVTGFIGGAYYVGFMAGSKFMVSALARLGHIRVFTALASIASIGVLIQGLAVHPIVWIVARFAIGIAMAGSYITAEAWLNDLASPSNRGRLLAVYAIVIMVAFGGGQLLIGVADPKGLTPFVLSGVLFLFAVSPVALSEAAAPPVVDSTPMTLRELHGYCSTAVGAALLVGVAHGSIYGMGAAYASASGLSPRAVGLFLFLPMIGGVLLQWPISATSDYVDRRAVMLAVTVASVALSVLLVATGPRGVRGMFLVLLLGGMTFPLYALVGAYANDWTPRDRLVAASSRIVLLYGIGACAGPPLTGASIALFGVRSFFGFVAALHAVLATYLIYRRIRWKAPVSGTPTHEVPYPARAFVVTANVLTATRSLRPRRRR
jgi:MFS family permease